MSDTLQPYSVENNLSEGDFIGDYKLRISFHKRRLCRHDLPS